MNPQKEVIMTEQPAIYVTGLIYLKPGKEDLFTKYRSRASALLEKYDSRLERVIRPLQLAQGNIDLPNEIHFAVFKNEESMKAINEDPEYIKLVEEYRTPSVEKMEIILSKPSDFQFTREIGDHDKTYGVALVYLKEGRKFHKQFEEYHNEACKIIPEFGTHFERFLVPFDAKGQMQQPSEVHRFYFDSQEGMKQMVSDARMQQLFPKRDESLSNLIFIIGQAIL